MLTSIKPTRYCLASYLVGAKEVNRTKPQLKIRLDRDVKAWLERKAKNDERPQCWLINKALKEAMRYDEAKHGGPA